MDAFEKALATTLAHEGFFSNDPQDRGGATTWGITEQVARKHGYRGDMKDLPVETAKEIYRKSYWDKNRLDEVADYYEPIAAEMFDTGVNMGVSTAGEFLQRAINCLNRNQTLFPDLEVDGIIGSKTINALGKLGGSTEKQAVLITLNALQGERYVAICERDPRQEKYYLGWIKRASMRMAQI